MDDKFTHAEAVEVVASLRVEATANATSGDLNTASNGRRFLIVADVLSSILAKIPDHVYNDIDDANDFIQA